MYEDVGTALVTMAPQYIFNTPLYAVWVIGLVLALRERQRRPYVVNRMLWGLSILFVLSLAEVPLNLWLPFWAYDRFGPGGLGWVLGLFNILTTLCTAGAWAFILAALFGSRAAEHEHR